MHAAGARRIYEEKHKDAPFHNGDFENWHEKFSPSHPYRYDDGVTIWVSRDDLTPDDNFI